MTLPRNWFYGTRNFVSGSQSNHLGIDFGGQHIERYRTRILININSVWQLYYKAEVTLRCFCNILFSYYRVFPCDFLLCLLYPCSSASIKLPTEMKNEERLRKEFFTISLIMIQRMTFQDLPFFSLEYQWPLTCFLSSRLVLIVSSDSLSVMPYFLSRFYVCCWLTKREKDSNTDS